MKGNFAEVPKNVAEQWLHRHWGQSPYEWLPSSEYKFSESKLKSSCLKRLYNRLHRRPDDWDAIERGMFICDRHPEQGTPAPIGWLANYMITNRTFPQPIILLDNTDGHLATALYVPTYAESFPNRYIVIEGHTRHEIGLYLHSVGEIDDILPAWIMHKS